MGVSCKLLVSYSCFQERPMLARVIGWAVVSTGVAVGCCLFSPPVSAQTPQSTTGEARRLAARPPAKRAAPARRTEDGRPDLQGVWGYATITPLERPAALGDKAEFATDDELAEFE